MAPLVSAALAQARVVAGYSTYLDLIEESALSGKTVIATAMMGEVERCGQAIESALSGLDTLVVSGGDPGVYGMAGLVLEMLEAKGLTGTVPFEVLPGIPALAAAAALLGAPLTQDFACVSLSDLLTPWDKIEARLRGALAGDFVLVLYNPRSKKRSGLLAQALDLARDHRGPQTPVGMVRQAYRQGQEVRVCTLDRADPEAADMLTIVIVGNSQTRLVGDRMLTPRGYAGKYDLGSQA
jgi:precorrin-3B C17-methyltransferase